MSEKPRNPSVEVRVQARALSIISSQMGLDLKMSSTSSQAACKGWQQEAALRMLLNNLDPEVAEKPEELGYEKSGIVPKPQRFSVATTVPAAFSRAVRQKIRV